jgi:hypothetical protein
MALWICRPLKRAGKLGHVIRGSRAEAALTPGYYLSRLRREYTVVAEAFQMQALQK